MSETRPISPPDSTTESWWNATKQGSLLVQRCRACAHVQHYPRTLCTKCASTDLEDIAATGRGMVYSFTVVHRSPHPAFEPPYAVALVRLDEGPVLVSNITGCAPEDVRCDMPVSVTWEDLPDGRRLPLFTPAGG